LTEPGLRLLRAQLLQQFDQPLLGPLASLGSLLAGQHQNVGAASPDPDRMAALAGRRPAVNAKYPKTTIRICPV
jgi:hypothetical protein